MNTSSGQSIDEKTVLAKAFFNASEQLNLTQTQLATMLGISETAINQLKIEFKIDPTSQQGEIALSIIRLFKSLHDLSGGDLDWIQHFLNSKNKVTRGIPIEQIETSYGLVSVLQFVEAIKR